jgi:bacteriocin-like protein
MTNFNLEIDELTIEQLNNVNGGSYGRPEFRHPESPWVARWQVLHSLSSQMNEAFGQGFNFPLPL